MCVSVSVLVKEHIPPCWEYPGFLITRSSVKFLQSSVALIPSGSGATMSAPNKSQLLLCPCIPSSLLTVESHMDCAVLNLLFSWGFFSLAFKPWFIKASFQLRLGCWHQDELDIQVPRCNPRLAKSERDGEELGNLYFSQADQCLGTFPVNSPI